MVGKARNRGVTYWTDGRNERIFYGVQQYVYSIDARTGKPDPEFGSEGSVDLRNELGRNPSEQSVSLTSPGVIYKDLLIVGSIVSESFPLLPAISALTSSFGKLRWEFHSLPTPASMDMKPGQKMRGNTSEASITGPGMTLDRKRGIVYIPTGSAAFDFYGSNRLGDNLFANCLLALNARHRQADLALPDSPSRFMGSRSAIRAGFSPHHEDGRPKWMRWRRPRNPAMSSCSTGIRGSRYSPLRKKLIQRVMPMAKGRQPRSRCL